MNKVKLIFTLFLFIATSCLKAQDGTIAPPLEKQDSLAALYDQIRNAEWKATKATEGVIWKYFHFNDLYSSKQFVSVIEVDLDKGISVDLPYVTEGFMKTSEASAEAGAVAAINGSFFDTKIGGSTVFLKKDGKVINETRKGFTPYREEVGFAVDGKGKVAIVKRPAENMGGWNSVGASTLLASGPLLVYDGELVEPLDNPFNTNRHPRTAIGVTADKRVICVVVDGRSSESYGMSISELAKLMHALGCKEAMNLDGGGSSTAWVQGEGIVNHPTDNKKFDHEGERSVANAILFMLR